MLSRLHDRRKIECCRLNFAGHPVHHSVLTKADRYKLSFSLSAKETGFHDGHSITQPARLTGLLASPRQITLG